MKDRKAEACRHSADEARKVAYCAGTSHEREAFQRLADGYDVLGEKLEQIAARQGERREYDLDRLRAWARAPMSMT